MKCDKAALKIAQQLGNSSNMAKCYMGLANAEKLIGNYRKTIEYLIHAEKLQIACGNKHE